MKYRIEQNRHRDESMDGTKPLQTATADSRAEAKKKMFEFAANGYYSAIFNENDGECLDEYGEGV